ncbi:MAG: 4Fe-4S dicluster domain-containing protein, partial [Candidatus Cryptobacteroides sp.]
YCMPCPYGIDIPSILLHYNKCLMENEIEPDMESDDYRRARRAYLVSYDRAVEKVRQASHCIGCGQCMSHCPQSIDIPKELRKIDRYIEKLRRNP